MADFDLIKKLRSHALRRQTTDTALAAAKAKSPIPHGIVQRALANPHTLQSSDLLDLQRTIGNRAVSRMLQRSGSSLRVGASDDRFEQEANRVSEQVSPAGQTRSVQRSETQAQVGPDGGDISSDLESRIRSAKGGGSRAPEGVRRAVEGKTDADLSHVRVHNDKEANSISSELGAKAATHGKDIFLGRNQSPNDLSLMAHELTHTIQQTGGQQLQRQAQQGPATPKITKSQPSIQRKTQNLPIHKAFRRTYSKLLNPLVAEVLELLKAYNKIQLYDTDYANQIEILATIGKKARTIYKNVNEHTLKPGTVRNTLRGPFLDPYIKLLRVVNPMQLLHDGVVNDELESVFTQQRKYEHVGDKRKALVDGDLPRKQYKERDKVNTKDRIIRTEGGYTFMNQDYVKPNRDSQSSDPNDSQVENEEISEEQNWSQLEIPEEEKEKGFYFS